MKSSANRIEMVLGAYFSYFLFVGLFLGITLGGVWHLSAFLFLYLVVPFLDAVFPPDRSQYSIEDFSKTELALLRLAPAGYVLCYAFFLVWYFQIYGSLSLFEKAFAAISMGVTASILVTASHELIHKRYGKWQTGLARLGLMLVGSMHFEYAHLFGHHKDACTPRDNHTAWNGESFYSYLPRTTRDAYRFCWRYERERLLRKGIKPISVNNRLLWFFGSPLIFALAVYLFYGPEQTVFFAVSAYLGIFSLEAVAYIEHYGLMREKTGDQYQKMNSTHSWNSYHRFSNYLTFMLQRHADHHKNASKDYFLLRVDDEAPELPFGYPLLILLICVPVAWRRLIHPIMDDHLVRLQNAAPESAA